MLCKKTPNSTIKDSTGWGLAGDGERQNHTEIKSKKYGKQGMRLFVVQMRIVAVMTEVFIAVLRFEFLRRNSAKFNEIFRKSLSALKTDHNAYVFDQMFFVCSDSNMRLFFKNTMIFFSIGAFVTTPVSLLLSFFSV